MSVLYQQEKMIFNHRKEVTLPNKTKAKNNQKANTV